MGGKFLLNDSIHIIDSHDLNREGRTSSYLIQDEKTVLLEPSASPSVPYLLSGLKQLNVSPEAIDYIIVTHIHLDHAGGTGLLLKSCPNAKVIVHPKGARHLANPKRLIEGARAVYGSKFDELFSPILPIPESRILVKEDGETLEIGKNRTLEFIDSPGHANHHFSILDSLSRGIFTGDTIGIFYQELLDQGLEFYLPSTSPNQFDPKKMMASAEKISKYNPEVIYFSHYGASFSPEKAFSSLEKWLPVFLEAAETSLLASNNDGGTAAIKELLFKKVQTYLRSEGIPDTHRVYEILELDLSVCAMGLADYFKKGDHPID
ncbi:MBL fold metallo-hydrolase [Metabacillus sp. RGM 3146]|uniref:MBL fold metallo-hydrolase n=1 Tax=Metabacillus sp. RGM 3146 TaxID=3401092 RepID=UPI003B9D417F